MYRGQTYARKGEYDKAIADYSEAIALDQRDFEAYYGRGSATPHFAASPG